MLSPFPADLVQNQENQSGEATPLNQIEAVHQRLRFQEVFNQAPRQITAKKDAKARALG